MVNTDKKRKSDFKEDFVDIDGHFDQMRQQMEDLIVRIQNQVSADFKELSKNGETRIQTISINIDSDGKSVVKEYTNEIPKAPKTQDQEPLLEVLNGKNNITVVAEIPKAPKSEIHLDYSEKKLSIIMPSKNFSKIVELPSDVDFNNKKVTSKNGVLEIILQKI